MQLMLLLACSMLRILAAKQATPLQCCLAGTQKLVQALVLLQASLRRKQLKLTCSISLAMLSITHLTAPEPLHQHATQAALRWLA